MYRQRLYWNLFPVLLALVASGLLLGAWSWHVGGWRWLVGAILAAAAAGGGAWLLARRIAQPLEDLRQGVLSYARGELGHKIVVGDIAEVAELAETLQVMAQHLDERMDTILRQNHEQQAVLASMVEGVLAVDTEERVISLNRAAARLLGTNLEQMQGRSLQEVVRNADLRRFVAMVLVSDQPLEGDVVLRHARERVLQANGTALRDSQGNGIGAVIVLNDVSRLRQLENMRRDFAANVSHELKTPITSIKGFVETLLDGAVHSPDDTERFLKIIARQAERLDAIIEDLLSLSKIEREAETSDILLTSGHVREVLENAIHDCERGAAERQITLSLACPDEITARCNAQLLQQAVGNLLDNAIKYSEPGREVVLSAERTAYEVAIRVRDQGCGIAAEHHSRLFERFYRVDKARSRKVGGTGLGLAIVKHIVLAHRGQVSVESKPAAGSTFTIHLPLP